MPHLSPAPGFLLRQQVSLAPYTTFGIGGAARYFAEVASEEDLVAACAWARAEKLPVFVLGGGSNLLVADAGYSGLVLHIALRGIERTVTGGKLLLSAGAGEDWDGFVSHAVAQDYAGVECLAGIPGSVGGTPVQNVGAYGQEVAETIESVRCYDRETAAFVHFTNAECRFRYRESRFNSGGDRGRYIVAQVRFALTPAGKAALRYPDVQRVFARATRAPSLAEVAQAVREIRRAKGMVIDAGPPAGRDPDTRSAGSFFKNPIVAQEKFEAIAASSAPHPVPSYPAPESAEGQAQRKLPAAWLVEQAGFARGYALGGAAISSRHTLALTNRSGNATAAEVAALRDRIVAGVQKRFGVTLEPEPVVLGTL